MHVCSTSDETLYWRIVIQQIVTVALFGQEMHFNLSSVLSRHPSIYLVFHNESAFKKIRPTPRSSKGLHNQSYRAVKICNS